MTTTLTRPTTSPRRLLEADAAGSAAVGLALTAAPTQVADLLGTTGSSVLGSTTLRWLGVALLVLAVDLAVLARTRVARPAVLVAGIGSIAWELASLTVAVVADLSVVGTVLVVGQGLAFGALGVLQLRAGAPSVASR
jgi:hypothetical protein